MPVTASPRYSSNQPQVSCFDRMKMGFGMGMVVGMTAGVLIGGVSCFRAGLRGREFASQLEREGRKGCCMQAQSQQKSMQHRSRKYHHTSPLTAGPIQPHPNSPSSPHTPYRLGIVGKAMKEDSTLPGSYFVAQQFVHQQPQSSGAAVLRGSHCAYFDEGQQQIRRAHVNQPIRNNEHDNESIVLDEDEEANERKDVKLIPVETDFMMSDNKRAHFTDVYELQSMVLRRGQPFTISIKFDKPYDPSIHKLSLQFTLGTRSLISKGTHIRMPTIDGKASLCCPAWSTKIVKDENTKSEDDRCLVLEINTPPDAIVGRYKMYIETQVENSKPSLFRYTDEVLLIFNPFNEDDSCFMQKRADIDEYVMNEKGVYYSGTESRIVCKHWHLGQFQFPCLEIALWLLERANLPFESRSDPTHIVRALSAMINGGDKGMLVCMKGTSVVNQPLQGFYPYEWAGSVKIVKKFMEQRGQPVKYGDCSTFAALLCTMCRTLGLPCRIVTGFNVAHNCDCSSTFDVHWDKNHRPIHQLNKDTIWMHHSWNEVWFRRIDVAEHLNGWQAVDATPNCANESLYRVGPCPVNAICSGSLSTIHDCQYFSAFMNSYQVHWMVGNNGEMSPIGFEEDALASIIVAKSVESDVPDNITASYKVPDDVKYFWPSALARKDRLKELCSSITKSADDDVQMDVSLPNDTTLGDTIVICWNLKNTNKSEKRTCEFYMSSVFATYDSTLISDCKESRGETVVLEPEDEKRHLMKIRADDYMDRIRPCYNFKVFIQGLVIESGQIKATVKDVCLDSYDLLKLIVDKTTVEVGKSLPLRIQISNPLKRVLQQCSLHMEGVGVPRTVILERSIRPLETTVYPTQITPLRVGEKRKLIVNFSSLILSDIQKCIEIDVVATESNEENNVDDESVTDK